jgi:2,3-bisphosphoglycerate-independent phosphoglycerate mutase
MTKNPLVLMILDGWGYQENTTDNAIALAKTPIFDHLWKTSPHLLLSGSGEDVGLPEGQMGNSEVGHMTIGSGRVIDQDLSRISKAIAQPSFANNPILRTGFEQAWQQNKAIHLMGLFSPGGIHSHEDHFFAILDLLKNSPTPVYVHAFLDGRDTPPKSAQASLEKLQNWFKQHPVGQIASITGRFYAMDRDKRYERTKLTYDMLTDPKANSNLASPALMGLMAAYAEGTTDEFIKPMRILSPEFEPITIQRGDTVFFVNFRSDRTRQLSYALTSPDFTGFERKETPMLYPESHFITMTQYAEDLSSLPIVFPPQSLENGLGEILQNLNKTQLRIAETEKYAHVTFFFNGGKDEPYRGEDRILIPSPKVQTYDEKPEMSAYELTDALVQAIESQRYDVIICNYANADMVGHTGQLDAAIKAVETLDECIGKVLKTLEKYNGDAFITADHGNVECMKDAITHQPHTAHTTHLVPFIYVGKKEIHFKKPDNTPTLADIAPTLLDFMGITPPHDMTGQTLVEK